MVLIVPKRIVRQAILYGKRAARGAGAIKSLQDAIVFLHHRANPAKSRRSCHAPMITKITLDNYMSHAHTVIEPAPGLTVIVGPNNCGKSAIVSALQTLCGDNIGDFMVRHGESHCAVTVETDDGHTICWQRKGKTVSYILDGKDVHRTGRGNLPDDLQALLRLGKVAHPSKDEEFDVHFGAQKSPIFLIDREADTAAFFSTASDAEKLIEMQKLHKSKVTDRRRQLAETKSDLAILEGLLGALSPLDVLGEQLESVAGEEREIERLEQEIVDLEELLSQTVRQGQLVAFHQRAVAAITPLRPLPELAETEPLEALAGLLAQTRDEVAHHTKTAEALALLHSVPEQEDLTPLAQQRDRLQKAQRVVAKVGARTAALRALTEPPVMNDIAPLEQLHRRLTAGTLEASAALAIQAALAHLAPPPMQEDPAPLAELLARFATASSARLKLLGGLEEVAAKLKTVEADMAAWLWANPNCPTCGQPTSREHFLSPHAPVSASLGPMKGEAHV
jgi:exonuclease SbcC